MDGFKSKDKDQLQVDSPVYKKLEVNRSLANAIKSKLRRRLKRFLDKIYGEQEEIDAMTASLLNLGRNTTPGVMCDELEDLKQAILSASGKKSQPPSEGKPAAVELDMVSQLTG